MQNDEGKSRIAKLSHGGEWQIGTAEEADWITKATTIDRTTHILTNNHMGPPPRLHPHPPGGAPARPPPPTRPSTARRAAPAFSGQGLVAWVSGNRRCRYRLPGRTDGTDLPPGLALRAGRSWSGTGRHMAKGRMEGRAAGLDVSCGPLVVDLYALGRRLDLCWW
jgi:hypothetical protein